MSRIPALTGVLLPALLLGLVAPLYASDSVARPAMETNGAAFTVMTYNCGSAAVVPLSPERIARIADEIGDIGADIVGINEFDHGTAFLDHRDLPSELAVALAERGRPMFQHFGPAFAYRGGHFVQGLLSRYPILQSHRRDFGSNWVVYGITVEPAPGVIVNVFQTHIWPHTADSPEQARRLAQWVRSFDGASLFMGDFNTVPGSATARAIASEGFVSSCEAAPGDECRTCGPGASMVAPLPLTNQIDYIWGNAALRFTRSASHITSMADHWPLWARVVTGPTDAVAPPPRPEIRDRIWQERRAAMALYRDGDYPGAAAALAALAEASPAHECAPFALHAAGMMRLRSGNADAAKGLWKQVRNAYPRSEWAVYATHQLAFLARAEGRFAEAEELLLRYLDLYAEFVDDNPYSDALRHTVETITELRRKSGGDVRREDLCERILHRFSDRPIRRMAHYQLANYAHDRGDLAGWYRHHEAADPGVYRYGPGQPDNDFRIARAYVAAGDLVKADENWSRLINFYDDPLTIRRLWGQWTPLRYPERLQYAARRAHHILVDGDLSDWPAESLTRLDGLPHAHRSDGDGRSERLTYAIAWDNDSLYLGIEVNDGPPVNNHPHAEIWRGDSLQIAFDPGMEGGGAFDDNDFEFIFALNRGAPVFAVSHGRDTGSAPQYSIGVVSGPSPSTVYEVKIPLADLGIEAKAGTRFRFNALVNDQDDPDGSRLGWIDITPGIGEAKSPGSYLTVTLTD